MLNNLGTTFGFIAYGEFFHNKDEFSNILLNITTTFVTLNENIQFLAMGLRKCTFGTETRDISHEKSRNILLFIKIVLIFMKFFSYETERPISEGTNS